MHERAQRTVAPAPASSQSRGIHRRTSRTQQPSAAGPVTVRAASSHYLPVIDTPQSGRRRAAGLPLHHHPRPASGKREAFAVAEPASEDRPRRVPGQHEHFVARTPQGRRWDSVDRGRLCGLWTGVGNTGTTKLPLSEVKHDPLWGQRPPLSLLERLGPRYARCVASASQRADKTPQKDPLRNMTIVKAKTSFALHGVCIRVAQPPLSIQRRMYPLFLCNGLPNGRRG
jgi:hypothetical protein